MSRRHHLEVVPAADAPQWVIGYGRVSSKEQAKGDSVSGQAPSCDQIAQRHGMQMIAFFFDKPHTGKKIFKRKGWEAAVAAAASGLAGVIVARDTARFHRNDEEFQDYERRIIKPAKLRLLSGDGWRENLTTGEYVKNRSLDMVATTYSRIIGDSTRDGKLQMRLRGFWPDGLPDGYRRRGQQVNGEWLCAEDRELVPDPVRAPIVREIVARLLAGESHDSIAADLTERGVPGPKGGPWYESSIFYIVRNPLNAGWITYRGKLLLDQNGEPIRMRGEPLWDDATWQRIRPNGKPAVRAREDRYIFAGLLFTSHFVCLTPSGRAGQIMPLKPKSQTNGDLLRYKPAHTFDKDYRGDALDPLANEFPAQLNAREVDELLIRQLIKDCQRHPDVTFAAPAQQPEEAKATVQQQLTAKRAEVARMKTLRDNAVEMKFLPEAQEYRAALQRLELEEAALKRRLREVSTRRPAAATGKRVNHLAEAWRRRDIPACRALVSEMLDYVDARATGPARLVDGEWRVPVTFEMYVRDENSAYKSGKPLREGCYRCSRYIGSVPIRLHERRRGRPRKIA